jgi:uncharacterized protein (DUF1697 family)
MARQIALLRGINVGGSHKVPMAQLREVLTGLGYDDVRTYDQSGNVVLTGPDRSDAATEKALAEELEAAFGFAIPVVVRTRAEVEKVIAADPYAGVVDNPARYHVLFLSSAPDPAAVAAVADPAAFAPDTYTLIGRELYLWTPEGIRDSKLVRTLTDKKLGVTTTARNWRTVNKLLELAADQRAV